MPSRRASFRRSNSRWLPAPLGAPPPPQSQSCTTSSKAITTQGGYTHATSTGARTKPKLTGVANPWRRNPGVHETGASSCLGCRDRPHQSNSLRC